MWLDLQFLTRVDVKISRAIYDTLSRRAVIPFSSHGIHGLGEASRIIGRDGNASPLCLPSVRRRPALGKLT